MDGTTHGKGTLRPVKLSDQKRSDSKVLNSNVINLWRLLIHLSIASLLGIVLIDNGWETITTRRIHITGNNYISQDRIKENISIGLPLITINPKYFESLLLEKLPIKAIKINKQILPPGIHVDILEREPVAIAIRNTPNGKESGMIDNDGYWIPDYEQRGLKTETGNKIIVDGWIKSHQRIIALIFSARSDLGSPLKKIILSPNREIILETQDFKMIYLGANQNLIKKQIHVLPSLINSLPKEYKNDIQINIDLKNPNKPKLLTP